MFPYTDEEAEWLTHTSAKGDASIHPRKPMVSFQLLHSRKK